MRISITVTPQKLAVESRLLFTVMAFSSGPAGYAMSTPSSGHMRVSYKRAPNFLERIGGSLCGSVFGLVLIAFACILLFLNEGRSVHRYNMLVETRYLCNPVKSPESVFGELDNKLIHISGKIATSNVISDRQYGVAGRYVRLQRKVEMYQWIEETEKREFKEPDGTIREERYYHYSTAWRSDVIHSNGFDDPRYHHNPGSIPVENMEWTADRTSVGRYELSRDAVSEISKFHTVHLEPESNYMGNVAVYGNMLYNGDPRKPEVGDVRVSYQYAGLAEEGREDTVTIVAKQSPGPVLIPYLTSDGYSVLFLYMERLSMDEVFEKQHAYNQALTWLLRGLGWLLTVIGFNLVAGILTTLVDWIPLVRELVSLSVLLLSIALGSSLSLVVIAIAWLRYHPLYGLGILLVAMTPYIISKFWTRSKNTSGKGS